VVTRGDVWLARLDPTEGREIRKTRPCLVISPPELHDFLDTVIIAPMTTGSRPAPFRVPIKFSGKRGFVLLDQIRTIDKRRLTRRLGAIDRRDLSTALTLLQELFSA
jgi:mRNA interferase MazF